MRATNTHRYRGFTILPCEFRDNTDQGKRWYLESKHSSGIPWGENDSLRFATLADARARIDEICSHELSAVGTPTEKLEL